MYENVTMRPTETVPSIKRRGIKEKDGRVNLRYIVSTFINITMYPCYNYNMERKREREGGREGGKEGGRKGRREEETHNKIKKSLLGFHLISRNGQQN
jgi:hypothetical protein